MQLNLICSKKDELRPIMNYVHVTTETMVATNAHVIGVIPTEELFDEDFILKIPKDGILIHREDFKIIAASGLGYTEWKSEGVIKVNHVKKRAVLIETSTQDKIGEYPNWQAIMPTRETRVAELNAIGVNAQLLFELQKSLGYTEGLKMQFSGQSKAIYCSSAKDSDSGAYGLIMPISID